MKVRVEGRGNDYNRVEVDEQGFADHVDVTVGGDEWEIAEQDGRLIVRLRSSNGSISRSVSITPITGNAIEIGTVRR